MSVSLPLDTKLSFARQTSTKPAVKILISLTFCLNSLALISPGFGERTGLSARKSEAAKKQGQKAVGEKQTPAEAGNAPALAGCPDLPQQVPMPDKPWALACVKVVLFHKPLHFVPVKDGSQGLLLASRSLPAYGSIQKGRETQDFTQNAQLTK